MLLGAFFTACQEDNVKVMDREYVLFQDTLSFNPVLADENYSFSIPVTSTVACDYDRTLAVEIIDKGSTAVEGRDYRLESNTVTIPAGKYSADLIVYPHRATGGLQRSVVLHVRPARTLLSARKRHPKPARD